jgi:CHAT domain-containing protein
MLGVPVEPLTINASGENVGERFAVSYVPSATIYTWLAEKSTREQRPHGSTLTRARESLCLAVGDPPFRPEDLETIAQSLDLAAAASTDSRRGLFRSLTALKEDDALNDSLEQAEDLLVRSALAGNREALCELQRLPGTREEATAVVSHHDRDSRLLLGPQATEQELARMSALGELAKYRTIHLATHALVDDERPERSALVLSQVDLPDPYQAAVRGERIYDGLLDAREIVREWKLDADLVTLSACETGLGKKVVGEGYVGLASAFLQAGARSLLVSLWRVEDRSTSMLMERFYENWRGGYTGVRGKGYAPGAPLSKVEALQEAKRWLREWRDEAGRQLYAHPYYWAGFILIGEPA